MQFQSRQLLCKKYSRPPLGQFLRQVAFGEAVHTVMLNYAGNACDAGELVIGPQK